MLVGSMVDLHIAKGKLVIFSAIERVSMHRKIGNVIAVPNVVVLPFMFS